MIVTKCQFFKKMEFLQIYLLKYISVIIIIVLSKGTKIIKGFFILIDAPIIKLMFAI